MAPFKRDLTPLSRRGRVTVNRGKGGMEQRLGAGDRSTLAGPNSMSRMMNAYPAMPQTPVAPTSAPPLGGPALGAPAGVPPRRPEDLV